MPITELILGIVLAVLSLGLIAAVLLQPGKDKRLSGAIAGAGESFLSKGNAKSRDAKLAKATKWIAIVFIVLTFVIDLLLLK